MLQPLEPLQGLFAPLALVQAVICIFFIVLNQSTFLYYRSLTLTVSSASMHAEQNTGFPYTLNAIFNQAMTIKAIPARQQSPLRNGYRVYKVTVYIICKRSNIDLAVYCLVEVL